MYENVGAKIKGLASGIAGLGIVFSIIIGFVLCILNRYTIFLGLIIAVVGSVISWLGSLFMAGFGELIHQTTEINAFLRQKSVGEKSKSVKTSNSEDIPNEKKAQESNLRMYGYGTIGRCEGCKRMTQVMDCKIGDMSVNPYNYKLCSECIDKYHAKIK